MNTKDGHVIVLCSESDENPDKLPRVRRFTWSVSWISDKIQSGLYEVLSVSPAEEYTEI